jgi:acyl carrier protein
MQIAGGTMSEEVTDSVKDRMLSILAEQALLKPSDISMDATLADLGIDSLGLVEAIFSIEEAFEVQVPFNANDPGASEFDISTVRTMVAAVEKLIAAQH